MALALNTSDPLYANLTYLFCVDDDNTVKEIRAGTALTVDPAVLLPNSGTPSTTTPYGRSFRTAPDGTFGFKGVTFSALNCPTDGKLSVFIVSNKFNAAAGSRGLFDNGGQPIGPGVHLTASQQFQPMVDAGAPALPVATTGSIGTGGHSWGFTRNGNGLAYAYIDGALDSNYTGGKTNSGGAFGYGASTHKFTAIGGMAGQGHASLDNVYIAIFVGAELTAADFSRLHSSLTGNNAFALVNTASPPAGTVTIGTITPTSDGASVAFTYSAADQTGFEYRIDGGTPASAGTTSPLALTGMSPGTYSLELRATNASGAGAWSAAAPFTVPTPLVKKWRVPTNAPQSTSVHVTVLSGSSPTYAIATQGVATIDASGNADINGSGTAGDKAFAFVHNYDDNAATTSIYGGPAIATLVEV